MNLKLEKIYRILKNKIKHGHINFVVPDMWNVWDYQGEELRRLPNQELLVNPYSFYASLIKDYYLIESNTKLNYLQSLSQIQETRQDQNWINDAIIYSSHIRTSAAWDHDRSFSLDISNFDQIKETGTFIKMLAYLPTLKKMGVNAIYLLPITQYSTLHKKGELGSPYAVKSFFELDPGLKESLTGDESNIEEEFKAFVEGCHILNMRIIIDIIPRTNAINSDFIKDHPDWFYWIKADQLKNYKSPQVKGIGQTSPPKKEYLEKVFKDENVKKHLSLFSINPKEKDPDLFKKLKTENNFLLQIEKEMNLTIAPAFSDWINDQQPPWSDITFFRFYFDHPEVSQAYVDKNQPPYILFDSIKSNLYPGKNPNKDLFNMIKSVIPYFQKNYGIDGARIDMGHALPKDLLDMIMSSARNIDPDFAFIAEELDPSHFESAYKNNYDAVVGNGFWMQVRYKEQKLREFIFSAHDYKLPSFAAAETHDTPRIAGREHGHAFSRLITVLNMFMPKMIPFINSGQEFYEVQPMNLGLDASEKDLYHLNKDDLFYKKLALFDKFSFHYLNPNRWEIFDHLKGIVNLRKDWLSSIKSEAHFIPLDGHNQNTIEYAYTKDNKAIIIVANTSDQSIEHHFTIKKVRQVINKEDHKAKLLYSTYELPRQYHDLYNQDIYVHLHAFELIILEI